MVGEDKPGGYDKAVSTILTSDSSCDFEELISKELRRKISASHCTHVCLLRVSKSSAGGDRRVRAMLGFLQVTLSGRLQQIPMAGEAPMGTDIFYPPLMWMGLHPKSPPRTSLAPTETVWVRAVLLPSSPAAPVWSMHWDSPEDRRRRVLGTP